MKTLSQRAESLIGWEAAIETMVKNPVEFAEPYWQDRAPSLEKSFYTVLAFGDFMLKMSKLAIMLPAVYHVEHSFTKLAEAEGKRAQLDQIGPFMLAQAVVEAQNREAS